MLIPLAAVAVKALGQSPSSFWQSVTNATVLRALAVTLGASLLVALIGAVMGTIVAWVLVRDEFPGKRIINALIDLPFALPTIVAGLTLLALYGPDSPFGIHIAFTRGVVVVALLFVTLPFVVRSVQPVLLELDQRWRRPPPRSGPPTRSPSGGSSCPRCARRSCPEPRWRSRARSARSARWC